MPNMVENSHFIINAIKLKPSLWNPKHPQYLSRPLNEQLWLELSFETNMSVIDLKSKWNSLRNSYCRSVRNDNVTPNKPRAKWYLEDKMDFLKPFVHKKKRKTKSTKKAENENTDAETVIIKDDIEIINQPILDISTSSEDENENYNEQITKCVDESSSNLGLITKEEEQINYHDEFVTKLGQEQGMIVLNSTSTVELNSNENSIRKPDDDDSNVCKTKLLKRSETSYKLNENEEKRIKLHEFQQQQPNSDNLFFESIGLDFIKLSMQKKRKFKTSVMALMNELLDETDLENGNVN